MNDNCLKNGVYESLKESLKKISYDKSGDEYMTDSMIKAFNFDRIKQEYTKKLHRSENGIYSVDAVLLKGDKSFFVEFKNGKDFSAADLCNKIRDSLLIYCDLTRTTITETRINSVYVVVYNKNKRPLKKEESLQCIIDNKVVDSKSRDDIKKYFLKKGKSELIRWGLAKYIGIYFEKVHTYDQDEFEVYLDKMDNC